MSDAEDKDVKREEETAWEDAERKKRQEELNKKLLKAAESGNNNDLVKLINEGADITSKKDTHDTGLHLSVCRGREDDVMTFINHGIDINMTDVHEEPNEMEALVQISKIESSLNLPNI